MFEMQIIMRSTRAKRFGFNLFGLCGVASNDISIEF